VAAKVCVHPSWVLGESVSPRPRCSNERRMIPNFQQQQFMNPMIQLNMENTFQPVNTGYINDHSSNAQILMMLAALQNNK
jgi:pyridoxal/pyridoxine/pyridoxamine kinase